MHRSFRIFRMWRGALPAIVDKLYGGDSSLANAPYQLQMQRFFEQKSSFTDYFSRGMAALGHEVMEVIFDLEPAQRAWARENGVEWNDENWQREIPLAQMTAFKPDILNLHSLISTPIRIALDAKRVCPFIRKVVGFVGSEVYDFQLPGVDCILVGVPPLLERYRALGMDAHLLYHAFDPSVLDSLAIHRGDVPGQRYPFTFIGTSGFGYHDAFVKRYWVLIELMVRTHLEAWVSDAEQSMPNTHAFDWSILDGMRLQFIRQIAEDRSTDRLMVYLAKLVGSLPISPEMMEEYRQFIVPGTHQASPFLPVVPLTKIMPDKCHPAVFGLDFFDLLSRSDVTLNVEADKNLGSSANMRMFEATGVGTCLLAENTPNVRDLFEPDREIVTYASKEECIEKSKFLLDNPAVCRQIAAAGQARTLRDHTVGRRCTEIDSIFQRFIQ